VRTRNAVSRSKISKIRARIRNKHVRDLTHYHRCIAGGKIITNLDYVRWTITCTTIDVDVIIASTCVLVKHSNAFFTLRKDSYLYELQHVTVIGGVALACAAD